MKKKILTVLATGLLLFVMVGSVQAVPVYFNDRATFDAAAGTLNFESFESAWSSSNSVSFGGFTLSETGGTNIIHHANAWVTTMGASITDGTDAAFYQDNGDSAGNFFSFTSPVTAFGLDITANFNATVDILGAVNDTLSLSNNVSQFWGVIELDGLSAISFDAISGFGTGSAGWDGIGFDAVSYGLAAPVPEPATMLLFGLGILGLAGVSRKKLNK